MTDTNKSDAPLVVTARALVVLDRQLLLVSHDGAFWYTPGGRLEPDENLTHCLSREVFEETGLMVQALELLHVAEYFEVEANRHKVECYFRTYMNRQEIPSNWTDCGPVRMRKFFDLQSLRESVVYPEFLKHGSWLDSQPEMPVYLGYESR